VYEKLKTDDANKAEKLNAQIASLTQKLANSKVTAPIWCILDENGNAVESSGGGADLIQLVPSSVVSGPHGPSLMRIFFKRFINQTPIITSVNSAPFECVATRGSGWQNEWDFSFTYNYDEMPRKGPWRVKMEIPN
jgi:hypothetical protein